MQALRNIYTVRNKQITINLPEYFDYSSVEVIILPINQIVKEDIIRSKEESLKKLLSISKWYEEDTQTITNSQDLINQWKIE